MSASVVGSPTAMRIRGAFADDGIFALSFGGMSFVSFAQTGENLSVLFGPIAQPIAGFLLAILVGTSVASVADSFWLDGGKELCPKRRDRIGTAVALIVAVVFFVAFSMQR